MFAVPGWSITASDLKAQVEDARSAPSKSAPQQSGDQKKSRKRKRGTNGVEVTQENVGELWSEVIEGRKHKEEKISVGKPKAEDQATKDAKERKRRRRKDRKAARSQDTREDTNPSSIQGDDLSTHEVPVANSQKEKTPSQIDNALKSPKPQPATNSSPPPKTDAHKTKKQKRNSTTTHHSPSPSPKSSALLPPTAPPPTSKLTPLQTLFTQKLTSARFRHLNQTLYTTPSHSALNLFTKSPEAYTSYHAGFRAQVQSWPSNPIDGFIADVRTRSAIRTPVLNKWGKVAGHQAPWKGGAKGKGNGEECKGKVEPLPRDKEGRCRIVDLGCGDAGFAGALKDVAQKRRLDVRSFDLARGDSVNRELVTVADITDLKSVVVADQSVDLAVCCLSLMGTNWVSVVEECGRVVRPGGEVWVAEIRSRFGRAGGARKGGVGDVKKGKGKAKGKKQGEEDGDEDPGAVVLEELEEKKGGGDETDVGAFVEVFRRRGFGLKGEVEGGNKMFVKMWFVKLAEQRGGEGRMEGRSGGGGGGGKPRFLEEMGREDEMVVGDEGKVLKPCVYKTR